MHYGTIKAKIMLGFEGRNKNKNYIHWWRQKQTQNQTTAWISLAGSCKSYLVMQKKLYVVGNHTPTCYTDLCAFCIDTE